MANPGTRFYLDVGRMETREGPGGAQPQLTVCRAMRSRGCEVTYAEFSGSHDYVNWRHNFPTALTATTLF
jgi:enterochelin esterase-like enzyme